jgi:hypothetical protein
MSPRWANVVTAAALAGLIALVALTAPRWARLLRQPLPLSGRIAGAEPGAEPDAVAADEGAEAGSGRRINVKLFFEDAERAGLVSEEREVAFSTDLAGQIRSLVEELIKGSRAGHLAPLPPETRVIEVFVTARGIAYVDLSKEAASSQLAGSKAELMAVYAVVNSITTNFPAVARVQILLDDRPAETLAGHVDLSRPLPPDMTLLAAVGLAPSPSPADLVASPVAAPSPAS